VTIENALEGADKVRKKLLTDSNLKAKDIKDAANVIEGLTRIIYWYDANQRRLIKSINKLIKRDKAMKTILTTYISEDTEVMQNDFT